MPNYLVTWIIDADDVKNPVEAAKYAREAQIRKGTIATVFEVMNKDTREKTRVDLEEEKDILDQLMDACQLGESDKMCDCGSGKTRLHAHDAQMIYLCSGCETCLPEKLKKYRPEILFGYDQSDVNEPIEPED